MQPIGSPHLHATPPLTLRAAAAAAFLIAGAILGVLLFSFLKPPGRPGPGGVPASSGGAAAVGGERPAGGTDPAATVPAGPSAGPDGYAAIVRAVMPTVVNISSLQVVQTYERVSPFLADPFFRDFFGDRFNDFVVPRERRALSLGSGVVVDAAGTILTNYHVVENAREVRVAFADGHEAEARILGADSRTDLAALRVEATDLPWTAMGDSERMQVGDVVLAIGNPFGIGQTVTMGIVSAIGRGSLGIADYEDFIQTDAAINPGNSGGALVNTRGEVIGINTAIFSRSGGYQGIGFAIPSNMARDVLDSLLKNGRVVRGYAGLRVQALSPDLARGFGLGDPRGAVVAALDPRGPAAAAGLLRGDVIVSLRGRPIVSDDELVTQLSRLPPGQSVGLEVVRGGKRLTLELVLGDEPDARPRPPARR